MSLESQIADLVTATNNLITVFNAKKSGIDTAVAAAIAAVPESIRNWYVDQINGLDTNAGTLAAPFKSLEKAMASTPSNGVCGVFMQSDYEIINHVDVTCAYLTIKSAVPTSIVVLKPKYFQRADGAGVTTTQMGGFTLQRQGAAIEIREINIQFPSSAGVVPAPSSGRLLSLFKTNGTFSIAPVIGVTLTNVAVTAAADWVGRLISTPSACIAFGCLAVSFPSDFAGKYIDGVAAGTDPKTLTRVLTTLSSL